jgi:hypothetical protein
MSGHEGISVVNPNGGWSRRMLVATVIASVAVLAIMGLSRSALSGAGPGSVAAAPSPERTAISRLLGADSHSFWTVRTGAGLGQRNTDQGLSVTYGRSGPLIHGFGGTVGIGLSVVGRGARSVHAQPEAPSAARNQVSYRRGDGIDEWYANGPLGLEQGLTLSSRPLAGEPGPLRFVFPLRGTLHPRLSDGVVTFSRPGASTPLMRYLGLRVTDARGRLLRSRLSLAGGRLTISFGDAGASYPITVDPTIEAAHLTASDGSATDRFGWSVAQSASGSLVVVGAPGADSNAGAAYVFVKPPEGWAAAKQTAELTDPGAGDNFGIAVAVVGTSVAVGAPQADVGGNTSQGLVDVYAQPAKGWSKPGSPVELTASHAAAGEAFGTSLAASGTQLFVGAPGANLGDGAVYEFNQPPGGWKPGATETAELTADGSDQLGDSVAADGSTVVGGAPSTEVGNVYVGAAYVFTKPAGGWGATQPEPAELTGTDETSLFGEKLAINASSGTIAVGEPYGNGGEGAVYVYQEPSGGWKDKTQTAELTESGGSALQELPIALGITNSTGTGPAEPPAGGSQPAPHAAPTIAGWNIGILASAGTGGMYVYPASHGSWSDSTSGTPVTLGIPDASPYTLSVEPSGIAVGQWEKTTGPEYGYQTGSAYELPNSFTISGKVEGVACSDDGTCRKSPLGGIKILVKGTAADRTEVRATDTSSNSDGSWSVDVPAGSYEAGASDDDSTFDLPGFSPDPVRNIRVGPSRKNVDFVGCAAPTGGPAVDFGESAVFGGVGSDPMRVADEGSSEVNQCTSVYTITIGGRIPAPHGTIVDPGPGARYNENDDGKADYRRPTTFAGNLHPGLENPACFDKADRKRTRGHGPVDWYSYIQGPVDLPKYKLQIAYDQHTEQTSLVGEPEAEEVEMTKVWVWHNPVGDFDRCALHEEVPFMYLPIPQGSGFTVIVAWGFPFEPTGVSGSLTKNEFMEAAEKLKENAPPLVSEYRRLGDAAGFVLWLLFKEAGSHVLLHLLTGPAAQAALVKEIGSTVKYAPEVVKAIATGASTLVTLNNGRKALLELRDYYRYAAAFESGEAIMSAVFHGSFDTFRSKKSPKAVIGTSLGITFKATQIPILSLSVSRSAYKAPKQTFSPFHGPLPWKDVLVGSKTLPFTANPWSGNGTTILGDPFPFDKNIGSGTGGLANLTAATHQLPAVNDAIHYGGLYQDVPGEEKAAGEASCPTEENKSLGLALATADYDKAGPHTICWLFRDGDA